MFVYFMMAGKSAIKIGIADDVERRRRELQVGNHKKLTIVAALPCDSRDHALEMERRFHRVFNNQRIRGEWFSAKIDLNKIKADTHG